MVEPYLKVIFLCNFRKPLVGFMHKANRRQVLLRDIEGYNIKILSLAPGASEQQVKKEQSKPLIGKTFDGKSFFIIELGNWFAS